MVSCPVCQSLQAKASYVPSTEFNGKKFDYLQCQNCRTIYVSPFPNEDDLSKMYSSNYHGFVSKQAKSNDFDAVFKLIKQFSKGNQVLDYGCGNAATLYELSQHNCRCTGVEIDKNLIENLKKEFSEIDFFSVDEFKSDNRKFDVIIVSNVLAHLSKPNDLLKQLNAQLSENGIIIVKGPAQLNFHFSLIFQRWYQKLKKNKGIVSHHAPTHLYQISGENQRQMFLKNGFDPLYFKIYEYPWPLPASLKAAKGPFGVLQFLIGQISLLLSRFSKNWGNLFIFVGKKK